MTQQAETTAGHVSAICSYTADGPELDGQLSTQGGLSRDAGAARAAPALFSVDSEESRANAGNGALIPWSYPQTLPDRAAHRAFDLGIAITLLLLLAPILLFTAALVRASGPGPVIFRHPRIGRSGKLFTCLKFRTMEHNAEELLPDLFNACSTMQVEWQEVQKIRRDPRVTPVGRWLRKFSIDELPQLWNVVRGEMSIVGPRPIVEAETQRYDERFQDYCSVKPGLTGLWQVSGRNSVSYERRVELDCDYVRTRSIRGDCLLILRTLPVVLRGSGY